LSINGICSKKPKKRLLPRALMELFQVDVDSIKPSERFKIFLLGLKLFLGIFKRSLKV